MAGAIAENFELFDQTSWSVPAYLFRYHHIAFDQLERMRRTGRNPTPIPGRSGDDCLAFHRDATGNIDAYIVAESKCTRGHSIALIDAAHKQASEEIPKGKSTPFVLEILKERNTEEANSWYEAISSFYYSDVDQNRYNLVVYVYGRPCPPERTRISKTQPHRTYTGKHELKAVEVSVSGVGELVNQVYREGGWDAGT
ncbi:MAG: hypothetical protein ACJ8AK_16650 [Gemmatimonadaceae bacterium]